MGVLSRGAEGASNIAGVISRGAETVAPAVNALANIATNPGVGASAITRRMQQIKLQEDQKLNQRLGNKQGPGTGL
jgi:hypothetical protein